MSARFIAVRRFEAGDEDFGVLDVQEQRVALFWILPSAKRAADLLNDRRVGTDDFVWDSLGERRFEAEVS